MLGRSPDKAAAAWLSTPTVTSPSTLTHVRRLLDQSRCLLAHKSARFRSIPCRNQQDSVVSAGNHADYTGPGLRFCEEGLNDAGQLTFIADFQDSTTLEQRTAVFRATPGP